MILKCAHCRSGDTVALLDKISCHACGGASGFDGVAYAGEGNVEVVEGAPVPEPEPVDEDEDDEDED